MWIRYKHKFAYGIDKKWSYIEINDDWKSYGYDEEAWSKNDWKKHRPYDEMESLGEYLNGEHGISDQYGHSDKYRGFDFEIVGEYPPMSEILERLKICKSNVKHYQKKVKKYQNMLDKAGYITKDDTDV